MTDEQVKAVIDHLCQQAHETACSKGWYDPPATFGERIAMMHCELSEAIEEHRLNGACASVRYSGGKPEGVPIELADVLIRIFDACAYYHIDLSDALLRKMVHNQSRTHRHGGKRL